MKILKESRNLMFLGIGSEFRDFLYGFEVFINELAGLIKNLQAFVFEDLREGLGMS
jgi:hypothetical protein